MRISLFLNAIRPANALRRIIKPKLNTYNAAYRNYRKFQSLEAHELRDMGLTEHDQKGQSFQDFLDAQTNR